MTLVHDSIFDPYQLKIKPQIRLPNEDMSVISHVGKVKLNNGIMLKDVLVVPSFKFSLLSVSKLTEDSKSGVSFYPKFCVVQDLTTRNVTGLGSMKKGLYHLVNVTHDKIDFVVSKLMQDSMQKFSLSALGNLKFDNKVPRDSYGLWHHRLGHVSDTKLKCMNDLPVSLIKTSSDNCLSCPMAKFTKLLYSLSVSHSTCRFQLIHIDIRGPYKVPTNGKFSYFLTIVDDYSRVWSDNALEFVKGQCGPYLESQGIVHQTSCVDRSQQNGRVERENRHILDTARALRFHSKLPLKFWGDCITTATYLINRIPSFVIGNKTPYEILLEKKPNYDNLRVFGCLAVVSNPSRTADKKSTRTSTIPNKLKDFVLTHTPRANSVSQTPLQADFQDFVTALLAQKDPVSFKEAILDPEWCAAMDLEPKALDDNGTWELTTLPVDKKAIGSYWLFKTKLKAYGTKERKNARLVIQGNRQRHGVDYEETFSPVAKLVTVKSLLAVAALKG
ncbi:retrovirus-related pol polyprotein from transposon TNT 1-94 [Tanacetum coccineum]